MKLLFSYNSALVSFHKLIIMVLFKKDSCTNGFYLLRCPPVLQGFCFCVCVSGDEARACAY